MGFNNERTLDNLSYASKSAPNVFAALNTFSVATGYAGVFQTLDSTGSYAALSAYGSAHAITAGHLADLHGVGNDCVDIFHKGSGDGVFVQQAGGHVAAFTFTADTASSNVLSNVSSFAGLTIGTTITGAGIPANTTISSAPNTPGAGQIQISQAATATAAGVTMSVAASGVASGNTSFNGMIPAYLDSDGTGWAGTIPNNRVFNAIFFASNHIATGGNCLYAQNYSSSAAVYIQNQPPGHVNNNGQGLSIDDYGNTQSISVSKLTAPVSTAAFVLSDGVGSTAIELVRYAKSGTVNGFVRSDGSAGFGISAASAFATQLQVGLNGAGITRTFTLSNNHNTNGDGVQIEFDSGAAQFAEIQGVFDDVAASSGSLRMLARSSGSMREYLRADGVNNQVSVLRGTLNLADTINIAVGTTTGTKIGTVGGAAGQKLGFFNATPIVQPLLATGAAHTVDDVITTLQNLGLVRQS